VSQSRRFRRFGRFRRVPRPATVAAALAAAGLLAACEGGTGPNGPSADLRGTWAYTGTQTTPPRELVGTFVVLSQSGAEIAGSLTWEERDGLGGVVNRAAPVSGRAIGLFDTDFDVLADDAVRRHVARISANGDTLEGVWIASSISRNGGFRAVRSVTP
jgi:hypothetical protein